jgi:hypothetical protein
VKRSACLIVYAALVCGCAAMAHPESAAVIIEPTDASRADLRDAVRAALGRSDVTLADDALTRDSVLLIEPTPARDAAGQRLTGRDFGRPEEFRLITRDGRCVLIHDSTGRQYELSHTRCAARD